MSIEKARKVCIRSDCPLRNDCRLHIFHAPPFVPTRTWTSDHVGHECHHFSATTTAVGDHLDGGID